MAFDAFISYASPDKTVADAVCARLEAAGIRCWIAPRDVTPGIPWAESIMQAIDGAKVMILVFSDHANKSAQVPREVERAISHSKPIIPFRIENVTPTGSLDYYIKSVHWLDAMTPPMERHIDSLAANVRRMVPGPTPGPRPSPAPPPAAPRAAGAAPASAPVAAQSAAPRPKPKKTVNPLLIGFLIAIFWLIYTILHHGKW